MTLIGPFPNPLIPFRPEEEMVWLPESNPNGYNLSMEIKNLHPWQVSVERAFEIQKKLANQVSRKNEIVTAPCFIAGVDISVDKVRKTGKGAVVVVKYPELEIAETKVVEDRLEFPYIPGLLSFRESPLILAACQKLEITPDLIIVDGQGIAHPRRMGIASHLGLLLDTPTIGCAKSLLCGTYEMPDETKGSNSEIIDNGEVIGAALRTKKNARPVFVSIGHKVDLETAIYWVLGCCRNYRLPEPARFAHLAAGGTLKETVKAKTT